MKTVRRLGGVAVLAAAVLALTGCVPGPALTGDGVYVANTSHAFRENRAFYMDDAETMCVGSNGQHVSVRPLRPIYEAIPERVRKAAKESANKSDADRASALEKAFTESADNGEIIRPGSPLSIVVSQVRIPESVSGPVDVAVVLDILTGASAEEQKTSLVVFYQRDVRGGMTLNFNNLLVYSTEKWDAAYPPYFRLRVLDVKTERNTATGVLLDNASDLAQSLGEIIPSSYIPGINLAIKTAKLILSNQQNQVIIDFAVQFFASDFVNAAGSTADLGTLQRGAWAVVGRPRGEASRFWRSPLVIDRRTGELFDAREVPATPRPVTTPNSEPVVAGVQSPYILMTTVPYSAKVYSLVQERSLALLQLLTSRGSVAIDPEKLSTDVARSVKTFVLIRDARRERTKEAIGKLVKAIFSDLESKQGTTYVLKQNPEYDAKALREELRIVLPKEGVEAVDATELDGINTWWNTNKDKLVFLPDKYKLAKKE